MIYSELQACLPSHFEMLLVASQRVWSECSKEGVVCVTMPLKVYDLLNYAGNDVGGNRTAEEKEEKQAEGTV